MRCKIDENVPVEAAELLRAAGHDCETVYDERLSGAPDAQVLARCQGEGRVLVTLDLDFGDIRVYPPGEHAGIMVLRPSEPERERILRLLARVLRLLEEEPIERRLWIVEEERVRIRRADDPAV